VTEAKAAVVADPPKKETPPPKAAAILNPSPTQEASKQPIPTPTPFEKNPTIPKSVGMFGGEGVFAPPEQTESKVIPVVKLEALTTPIPPVKEAEIKKEVSNPVIKVIPEEVKKTVEEEKPRKTNKVTAPAKAKKGRAKFGDALSRIMNKNKAA
jgi:hypothetical protein